MSRRVDVELVERLLGRAGASATLLDARRSDWASATFVGRRHRLRLAMPAGRAADAFVAGLEEAELALRGAFVADVAVVVREERDDVAHLTVEVLTIDEA